jgi:carboxyl-terminal processing protease
LKPLWEVWDTLQDSYVDKSSLDARRLGQGATQGLLTRVHQLSGHTLPPVPASSVKLPKEAPAELQPVWDAWVSLHEAYPDGAGRPDPAPLAQAAIRGLLEALGDPHTAYIPPDLYQIEARAFEGNYEGIGAEIYQQGDRFLLNPMPGSPSSAAGMRPGDILLTVDGRSVAGWSVLEAVNHVRGRKGSVVRLEVQRLGQDASIVLAIRRGVIDLKSVFWSMTDDQNAYVRLGAFYGNTDEALKSTLQEVLTKGAKGLILDLRNNPGGFLTSTVTVAGFFLKDALVTYEVNGKGKRTDHDVQGNGLAAEIPLVVLVNQFSASGSEILAGALQDHRRAAIVGTQTFGKGSVNLTKGLSDGGGLYYSVARWYTPTGRRIEGRGVQPDVVVPQAVEAQTDLQLQRAVQLLAQQAK